MGSVDEPHGDLDALVARIDEHVADARYEAAVDFCEALIDRYGEDEDRYAVDRVAGAMAKQCYALRRSGDGERLLAAVAQLNDRFGDASDPWLSQCAARGPFEQVWWCLRSGDTSAALAASEALISRFERGDNLDVRDGLGETLLWTASQLAWTGPLGSQPLLMAVLSVSPLVDATASAFAWVIARSTAAHVALPHTHWPTPVADLITETKSRRQRLEQALRIYELLIANYDDRLDPSLHKLAVGAKLNRGMVLNALGRHRSARSAWRDIFALSPTELAMITTTAQPHPDGGYTITQQVAAIVSAVSSPSGRPSEGEPAAQTMRNTLNTDRSTVGGRIFARLLRSLE